MITRSMLQVVSRKNAAAGGGGTLIYTSDFSAGTDGWSASQGTVNGNIDSIGGQNDNLRFTCNTATNRHYPQVSLTTKGATLSGPTYQITGDIYIPSTNSDVVQVNATTFGSGTTTDSVTTLDAWTSFALEVVLSSAFMQLRCHDGTSDIFTDAGGDDVIYVRNVVMIELP